MPRNESMEAPSEAIRAASPSHQISTSQVRELLEAVKRSPASMVQQVGNLFRLFVSVLEANLPSASAPPATSTEGRAAAAAARSSSIVKVEEIEVASKIVSSARARPARGSGLVDEERKDHIIVEGTPKDKVKTLQSWATRCKRRVPRLMDLLAASSEIAVDDALLVHHHAERIAPREAGKALSAAAAALTYITRVSGDVLAKARGKAAATNGLESERREACVLHRSGHDGLNAGHHPREDVIPAAVAAEKARTAAVRVQALVRGVIGRRAFRADNAAARFVQTCVRASTKIHEKACHFTGAGTFGAQLAAATVVQAFWRGVRSRDELFCRTVAVVIVQRWRRSTIVLRYLARIRKCALQHGAHVAYLATVRLEARFRSIYKTSVSMSAYSRIYRTAATLVQQRWVQTVKRAHFEVRCGHFDEAELYLRSLIRRRSQQAELDGVVKAFDANQLATNSASLWTPRVKVADEAWLVAAKRLLNAERSRAWGQVSAETIRNSYANKSNRAARQRASVVNKGACDSSGPVQGNLQADEPPVQAARISTDSGTTDQNDIAAGSKGRKVSTSRFRVFKTEASISVNVRHECSNETRVGDGNRGQGSDGLGGSPADQQVELDAHKSSTILTPKAPLSVTSRRSNIARVDDQFAAAPFGTVTTPRRDTPGGLCILPERPQTARESAAKETSAAIRTVPPTRKLPSLSQLRVLLNALMHSPVGAIQQVGFLLVLFVSVVEASLPTIDAIAATSIAGRPVAPTADSSIVVAKADSERATKIVAAAKARRARGSRLTEEGGKAPVKNVQNVKIESLRRWAARRNQKSQQLLRLLQATSEIGIEDALLVRYHAEGIERREAGKASGPRRCLCTRQALSAAAATLSYITRVSGDTISKARSDNVATENVVAEIHGTIPAQEFHHSSPDADRESIPVDAATAGMRTTVVRVPALARGVVAQRAFHVEKGLKSAHVGSISPVMTCLEMADESSLVTAGGLSKADKSRICGASGQEIPSDSSSNDNSPVAGQKSISLDPDTESGGGSSSSSSKEPGFLSDKSGTSKFAGGSMLESNTILSAYTNSKSFSETGVSSEEGNNPLENSTINTSEDTFTQQADTTSAMDSTMTLPFGRNRVIKAGGPPPTIQQAMVTFDEAIVWPNSNSVKADEAPVAGAENLPYGGGQIIGYNGQVISSKTHSVPSFSLSQTTSPRREGTPNITSPSEAPTSPPDKMCPSTPPSTPSPRRRRRREGGRTSPGRLRSRASSLSVFRVSTAARRPQEPLSTPPVSPDRLQTTDSREMSSCIARADNSATEAEDPKQAGLILPGDSAKKEQGSSQAGVKTPASDLLVSCLPAASVGSSSHDTAVRPTMRWGLEGTYQPRRRPALSRTGGPPSLPVARFRPTVCAKSKLLREQIVPESDDDSDDDSNAPPTAGTAVHLHGKSVNGWRKDGDELLETGIFPPARFLQFRTCPRYWCYQDYVLSDLEKKMCARIPAVLVGGGAGVLIADIVEEHGRPAVEIAIERSVRSAFNGSSRDTQWFPKSSEELQAGRDSLALSIASETAAGAGQNGTTEVEDTTNATVGARGAEAISDARALDGASELAAQWRTSLKEQERALQQCQARYCSAPSLTPGMRRAVGIPATDVACDPLTSLKAKTESEDSGLAALYGTSLQEQEQLLALSRF